jgi:hypothetical protein
MQQGLCSALQQQQQQQQQQQISHKVQTGSKETTAYP